MIVYENEDQIFLCVCTGVEAGYGWASLYSKQNNLFIISFSVYIGSVFSKGNDKGETLTYISNYTQTSKLNNIKISFVFLIKMMYKTNTYINENKTLKSQTNKLNYL